MPCSAARPLIAGCRSTRYKPHIAPCEITAPGLVELWPLVEPEGAGEPEAWDAPFDVTSQASPRAVLAQRIAKAIKEWTARGVLVGDGDKRHARSGGRYPHSGAPARRAVRGDHPRPEECAHSRGGRRPARC